MVDYLKFKNSTPSTVKTKKFGGSRYKEYLYGSLESLNADWADKIVDYNPDLKVDTEEFRKYLDRNMSVSTDCGFDLNTSVNTNGEVDVYNYDYSNSSNSFSDSTQYQQEPEYAFEKKEVKTNGYHPKLSLSSLTNGSIKGVSYNNVNGNTPLLTQNQKYEDLLKKYQQLSADYANLKKEQESYLRDAEAYRDCKERLNLNNQEFDEVTDPKEKLEMLLDHIYNVVSEAFGTENALVSNLEKFADLYINYQNKAQLELASLRGKAEVVGNLEKLVAEKTNYDKLLEQKNNTIDSLVEELKNSKLQHAEEVNKLKEELALVTSDYQERVSNYSVSEEELKRENDHLNEEVNNWKTLYSNLLTDQHQILSQLPLVSLQFSNATNGDPNNTKTLTQGSPVTKPWQFSNVNYNDDLPNSEPKALQTWPQSMKTSYQSPQNNLEDPSQLTKLQPRSFDNTQFLQSLVQTLYKKNEEAVQAINRKDQFIKNQQETIFKLRSSIKEWESDAVLWLDYFDQTSSLLNSVN